jgi:FkbM family methyltransferase
MTVHPGQMAKEVARHIWFRPFKTRRCHLGPYKGINFEITPALLDSRMAVFYTCYEPVVTDIFKREISPGMVVYDIGAHIGIHSLYICKLLQGEGKLYAFEPWPQNYVSLYHNLQKNPEISAVAKAVPAAVGDQPGVISMDAGTSDGRHHVSESGNGNEIACEVTLDTFYGAGNPAPSFIKVDVEGKELQTLRGAEQIIRTHHPKWILEHHGMIKELTNHLEARNYKTRLIGGRHIYAHA